MLMKKQVYLMKIYGKIILTILLEILFIENEIFNMEKDADIIILLLYFLL